MGVAVKPGDILVGKITPKGETQLSSEEKLSTRPFLVKKPAMSETPLSAFLPVLKEPSLDAKIFIRKGAEKDQRSHFIEDEALTLLQKRTMMTRS